jgi:serine/threonine-protein kinase
LAASGALAIGDALTIAIAIASDLEVHHRKGLVHGDIKPSNVSLPGGKPEIRWPEISQESSRSDEVYCTPMYASPEQIEGRQFDLRTDIYSLGVVVYEMLVGSPPFTTNLSELVVQKRRDPSPAIHVHRRDVPRGLELAIRRAMAKHAIDRFQNAPEFAQALSESIAQRGLIARIAGGLSRELKRLGRRRGSVDGA